MNISLINVNLETLITGKPGLGASSCISYNSSPISELSNILYESHKTAENQL